MKKKLIYCGSMLLLISGLILNVDLARATDPPETAVKVIIDTYCCKNGGKVGNSNDCGRGAGSCIDNVCTGAGVTENASEYCTKNVPD